MAYCTKDEVRSELQTDATIHDDTLVDGWIATAEAIIDSELNNTFETKKSVTEKYTGEGSKEGENQTTLFLEKRPETVSDITAIRINGVAYTGEKELYPAGKLVLKDKRVLENDTVEIDFNYGLASVPQEIKQLCIDIAAELSRTRDSPALAQIWAGEFRTEFKGFNPTLLARIDGLKQRNKVSDARII